MSQRSLVEVSTENQLKSPHYRQSCGYGLQGTTVPVAELLTT